MIVFLMLVAVLASPFVIATMAEPSNDLLDKIEKELIKTIKQ